MRGIGASSKYHESARDSIWHENMNQPVKRSEKGQAQVQKVIEVR